MNDNTELLQFGDCLITSITHDDRRFVQIRDVCNQLELDAEFWSDALQDETWADTMQHRCGDVYISLLTLHRWIARISARIVPQEKHELLLSIYQDARTMASLVNDDLRERLQVEQMQTSRN